MGSVIHITRLGPGSHNDTSHTQLCAYFESKNIDAKHCTIVNKASDECSFSHLHKSFLGSPSPEVLWHTFLKQSMLPNPGLVEIVDFLSQRDISYIFTRVKFHYSCPGRFCDIAKYVFSNE